MQFGHLGPGYLIALLCHPKSIMIGYAHIIVSRTVSTVPLNRSKKPAS
jgi:hypothetical protein